MKSIAHTVSIVSLIVLFCGCEKTFSTVINIDIPHTPMIAMECINIFDSTYASISSTVSVTGTDIPKSINHASALLYENNLLVDSFSFYTNGGYVSPFIDYKPGKTYKIIAGAPSFKTVEAEDECPDQMDILKTEFTKNAKHIVVQEFGNTTQPFDEFKITFRNNSAKKDYYKIDVTVSGGFASVFIISNDIDIDATGFEDILPAGTTAIYGPFTMADVNFNGREKTLLFYAPSAATDQVNTFWNIAISHLSESYYKFEKTQQLYNQNEGNPFAEPVQIFSNVKNGVGIFALKKDTVMVF